MEKNRGMLSMCSTRLLITVHKWGREQEIASKLVFK
jgi:hypothetical protein